MTYIPSSTAKVNASMLDYPIFSVVGVRGAGKTATMRALADGYRAIGKNIYSNFTMFDIEFTYTSFDTVASFPDWLHDGVIFLDEAQVGADAYDFFNARVKNITVFITQLRKRRLILFFSTQVFTTVVKRLRLQTDYVLECHNQKDGTVLVRVYDRHEIVNNGYIGEFLVYIKPFFKKYDTNEIIENG